MRRFHCAALAAVAFMGFASVASAATFQPKHQVYRAPVAAPAFSWTGLYVGGNVGYSWGLQSTSPVISGAGPVSTSTSINGVIGGGQIGYNWQFNQIVLGLEADIQASGQQGNFTTSNFVAGVGTVTKNATEKLDYFGTVRGRFGYTWNRYLAYFTGGWAYGHANFNGIATAIGANDIFSGPGNITNGWTVGGGLEWAFQDRWSAKIEYLYVDFGNDSRTSITNTARAVTATSGDLIDHIVRVGLNYHFL